MRHRIWMMVLLVLSTLAGCAPAAGRTEATSVAIATSASGQHSTAGHTASLPAGLRTDLRGSAITVVLNAEDVITAWEDAVIQQFSAATGIEVRRVAGPQSTTDRLAQHLQQWYNQSADADVYMIDVTWPGTIAPYAVDLRPFFESQIDAHFPSIVENNTVHGKLVGVPWYTDIGLLYYRTDLLQKYGFAAPPETWDELEQMAETIQDGERSAGDSLFWGFVWQGKAYEGLTCNALEWQVSYGGGTIINSDGSIAVADERAIEAISRARRWVGTISPEAVTNYAEPESLEVFVAGEAAFMRNWPYGIAVGNGDDAQVRDKFAVTLLPKGNAPDARHAGTLGGWQLMVSAYSPNKDAAIEFVKFMTSPEIQKSASIERALLPTLPALYRDAEVLRANPYYTDLREVLQRSAVPRPAAITGDLYSAVSAAYFTGVNRVLNGQIDATRAMVEVEQQLTEIMAMKN